ncbi:nitroreductase family protein [Sediminitomix flava]|uniref:Putative NAD(P)H nitroreductase n=1 Tax=Sediminitomix flava TaxID=379075 RepID=A0A315Z4R3_SEDFL|nr:nitroreductase [Sediminitomix flava]PWJ38473.1 nitroreductase [Sediminitomix flava]
MVKEYQYKVINDVIRSRRSVFPAQFSDKKIEKEVIDQILENANWAPNHGHTEPWRFFVFSGEGLKQLGEAQSKIYKEVTSEEDFDKNKFEKLLHKPNMASHVIAIAMKRGDNPKIPEIEEIEAVACAVQNIYLTATAYGVGGYWGSGGITYMEEAKELFGLGEDDKVLGFFYLGYPKEGLELEGKRKPIQEKVTWIE